MSKKINTSIPPNTVLGARQLSNQLKNLFVSRETTDYLAKVKGTLRLEISANSMTISHSIVDKKGSLLATTREFEQLANYKSIITKKKEQMENEKGRDEQTALYYNAKTHYANENGVGSVPARMLEANNSRFGQMKKSIEIIDNNMEVIGSLPASVERTYMLNQGETLRNVYMKGLTDCMGQEKYEQTTHESRLLGCCIPKFLEKKFTDVAFTKEARLNAKSLLFPKGNFMKTISFTTKEIRSDAMMRTNQVVISDSNCIIQLARKVEVENWFIPVDEHTADLKDQWEKVSWPMLMPGTIEDYLKPRINRVSIKPYSEIQAPKGKLGKDDYRPETIIQQKARALKNAVGKMISVMIDFYHYIPQVADPLQDFWYNFTNTDNWLITPDKRAYDWINLDTHRDLILGQMKDGTNDLVLGAMTDIVITAMQIPASSRRCKHLRRILMTLGSNTAVVIYPDNPSILDSISLLPNIMLEDLKDTSHLTDDIRQSVLSFRGKETEALISSKKKRSRIVGKSRLPKDTNDLVNRITDRPLRKSIKEWIQESFLSEAFQICAADLAVSAVEDEDLGFESSDDETSEYTDSD